MHRSTRTAILAVSLVLPLAGCGALTGNYDFDPTDLVPTDWFNTKKKLPGERKPVFPEGVPGTSRGIPQEYVRGYQAPPELAQDAVAPPQQASAQREPPKKLTPPAPREKLKPKPASQTASTQPAQAGFAPASAESNPPPLRRTVPASSSAAQPSAAASPWPDAPGARAGSAGPAPGGFQWPDPPASGGR
jgi:hypothetical protein